MTNTLDNLFAWAAKQPSSNRTTVNIALTTSTPGSSNAVTFASGTLQYAGGTGVVKDSSFSGPAKQYFSDRLSGTNPFNPHQTDTVNVAVTQIIGTEIGPPTYTVQLTIHALGVGPTQVNPLSFDETTGVVSGPFPVNPATFVTMAFCGQFSSHPPP
jgi:hypothetical protein